MKTGKCEDPDNYVDDIFKEGVIGSDLKVGILMMMNKIKEEIKITECLKRATITILLKEKL